MFALRSRQIEVVSSNYIDQISSDITFLIIFYLPWMMMMILRDPSRENLNLTTAVKFHGDYYACMHLL